ncbi:putative bifunctional diguanylate cyclase/phosphodiesterase [Vallicoccus soli]|uniref:putative bifunctional diguanylate cyclase/phosphodiesterase n=1 Tax=Vallicoccus soli TaxID=2339232 RepID=UPI001C49B504|nr:EAL domain-containing protein [Vallicoccus soli]
MDRTGVVARRLGAVVALLPEGRLLPEEVWRRRHAAIVRLALVQAVLLAVAALVLEERSVVPGSGAAGAASGLGWLHALHVLAAPLLVALPLPLARAEHLGRKLRGGAAATSLFTASAVLVHLASGTTEAHFHFFVMVGVVALYQDWVPFGVGLAITVGHHGALGSLHPREVYGTEAAVRDPWLWALVHGGFVLAASAAHLASWRLNEQQGLRDPLTGLANRTMLGEVLAHRLRRPGPVSVLFIDLDDFKDVNDSRGHAAGDLLLRAVADRLRGCARGSDVVARLGGDEFAVVVGADPATARWVGERVLRALGDPVHVDGRQLYVGASVGVADTATSGERSAEVLLRNADLAMYLAKAAGKHRLAAFADGMDRAVREKADLTADLARALAEGQLAVHYQPTVLLGDGTATGFEALLRWHHPERGLVPPDEFVPLAEETAHIHAIGAWVLRTAVRQAARWSVAAGRPVGMAVNLSPRQLGDDEVLTVVAGALAETGLAPQQLTLEVTEGVLVRDVDAAAERLAGLRAMGVRIAIDDFGTGYAGLSYLRRLPVDTVKIDRSFVSGLAAGGDAAALVSSIVELARGLGLDVVAEGVETEAQASVLRDLRCHRAQGFLYARPLPVADVERSGLVPGLARPSEHAGAATTSNCPEGAHVS